MSAGPDSGGWPRERGYEVTSEELRRMWQQLDPVPAGLSDRIAFALEVQDLTRQDLDLELLRLLPQDPVPAGARGEDRVRTITFGSDAMTVMLAISDVSGGHRIDGWVAPGGARGIEVRTAEGVRRHQCDETGRFALPLVPPGHFQLVLDGDVGATADGPGGAMTADGLRTTPRPVVTPALTL